MKHEFFLNNLTLRVQVLSGAHNVLHAYVDGDDVGGNAVVVFSLAVVNNP